MKSSTQENLLKLLNELEEVNTKLLSHLKNNPMEDFQPLIDKRNQIGQSLHKIYTVKDNQQALENISQELQNQSTKIVQLDQELLKEMDIITHKLQSKQQALNWKVQNNRSI